MSIGIESVAGASRMRMMQSVEDAARRAADRQIALDVARYKKLFACGTGLRAGSLILTHDMSLADMLPMAEQYRDFQYVLLKRGTIQLSLHELAEVRAICVALSELIQEGSV